MGRSIKISDETMATVVEEAERNNRSLSGQVEYFIKVGRAIENSPNFTYSHVKKALDGQLSTSDLSAEEQEIFFEEFSLSMRSNTPQQEAAFSDYIKTH